MDNLTQDNPVNLAQIPSPEDMLARLSSVDLEQFDIKAVTDELKGKHAWIFVLTMPISAILLMVFTLLGTFITGYFIASFVITAGLLFVVAKMLDQYEQKFRYQARIEVMNRIEQTEGPFGLIPHFKDFLPVKYRHLWQSLKKGNYRYTDQYIAAITLLQNKLEPDQFTRIWYIRHPEIAPPTETDE